MGNFWQSKGQHSLSMTLFLIFMGVFTATRGTRTQSIKLLVPYQAVMRMLLVAVRTAGYASGILSRFV
jgi:hypothetical protein